MLCFFLSQYTMMWVVLELKAFVEAVFSCDAFDRVFTSNKWAVKAYSWYSLQTVSHRLFCCCHFCCLFVFKLRLVLKLCQWTCGHIQRLQLVLPLQDKKHRNIRKPSESEDSQDITKEVTNSSRTFYKASTKPYCHNIKNTVIITSTLIKLTAFLKMQTGKQNRLFGT